MFFGLFRKKIKNINEDQLEMVSQADLNLIREASETIMVAEEVVRSLKNKLDDYVVQMQHISSMINDAIIMTNCNGIIESINTSASNIFGYDNKELIGNNFSMLLHNNNNDMSYLDNIAKLCEIDLYTEECSGFKKDNEMIHIEMSVSKIKRVNNSIYYIIIIKDITQRVIDQIQLHESEQYFRAFGEASTEAMMLHDDTKILNYNDMLIDLTKYSKKEIELISPYSIFPEKDINLIYNTEKCDETISTHIRTKEGEYVPVSLTNKNVNWNEDEAKIKVMKDISIYKKVENILRTSSERYRSVIDNNIDIVCCYNKALIITFANQTFLDYYNMNREDVEGKSLLEFFRIEDCKLLKENINDLTIFNPVKRSLYRVDHDHDSDSESRWQDWIDRGIFDDQNNLIEVQAVSRDITEYIKLSRK